MNEWRQEKEHIMRRLDRFDESIKKQGEQIDHLIIEVTKLAFEFISFKKEFKIKTSAWAFLGTGTAILIGIICYLIKNQLV